MRQEGRRRFLSSRCPPTTSRNPWYRDSVRPQVEPARLNSPPGASCSGVARIDWPGGIGRRAPATAPSGRAFPCRPCPTANAGAAWCIGPAHSPSRRPYQSHPVVS